jgi:hypothetical protein
MRYQTAPRPEVGLSLRHDSIRRGCEHQFAPDETTMRSVLELETTLGVRVAAEA